MRKTVKLISLGLAMILLFTPLISCGEIEYALVSSGNTSAEGFTYDLYEDGSAVITGGTVLDGILDIPASVDGHNVKAVGDEAFRSNVEFHYLKIAPSIKKIGKFAFAECQRLTFADVGQPTDIGFCAFYDCKNLTYLRGLDKVKTIEEMAFCGCLCLSSLTLPDTLTSIGERAFAHCVSLPSVRLPRSIKTIGAGVFFSCDSLAYADVSSLKIIPESTFTLCGALSRVYLSSKLSAIGIQAFRSCTSLQEIYLPKSLAEVGEDAFGDCPSLSVVNYSGNEKGFSSVSFAEGNEVVAGARPYCGIKLPSAPAAGKTPAYDAWKPSGDAEPGYSSGDLNYSLYPDGTAEITSYSGSASSVVIPDRIDGHTVVSIGANAFSEKESLKSVSIGKNVKRICAGAFSGCPQLSEISGGSEVSEIGINAFYGTAWSDAASKNEFCIFGDGVLVSYNGTAAYTSLPSGIKHVGAGAFMMNNSIVFADLGSSVVTIGDQAFAFCESLRGLFCPGLESIGDLAFIACTQLTYVDFSEKLVSIGSSAFADCYRLNYVCLGAGIESVGAEAFANCQNIRFVSLPSGISELRSDVFSGCMPFCILYPGTAEEFRSICRENSDFYLDDLILITEVK